VRLIRLVALQLCCSLFAHSAPVEKTDIVVLDNGDHITGEVIELTTGQLKFKTSHAGTLYIDWTHIVSLTTTQQLHIELANGKQLSGPAPQRASSAGAILIESGPRGETPTPIDVRIADIVELGRMRGGPEWYDRLEGDLSLGYSYTSANGVQTGDFSGEVGSRNMKRQWKVSLDMQASRQSAGPSTQWDSLVMSFNAFLANRYYRESTLQFERNEELGLDLRSLFAETFGRSLVQRQGLDWRAGAGLAVSTETGSNGSERQAIWLPLTTDLRVFRWDHPKIKVTADLQILPSLNEGGRVRSEASLKLRNELLSDFYVEISFKDSYDNRPAETAHSNDWNFVTSLGYSF
jgi:Protein of unknown function, DUF481